jgi:iron-sulfur cluster assembly accessory protein
MIAVTENAIRKIDRMLQAEGHKGKNLRVYVEGGGCSGLQYGFIFEDHHQADEKKDETIDCGSFQVVVDRMSLPFLEGASVDYVDTLMESGFKMQNPQAKSTCGCGHSFSA